MFFPTFLKFRIHGSPVCQCGIMLCPRSIQCACDDASIRCKGKDVSHKVVVLPSIVETTLDYAVARLLKIKFQTIQHTITINQKTMLGSDGFLEQCNLGCIRHPYFRLGIHLKYCHQNSHAELYVDRDTCPGQSKRNRQTPFCSMSARPAKNQSKATFSIQDTMTSNKRRASLETSAIVNDQQSIQQFEFP